MWIFCGSYVVYVAQEKYTGAPGNLIFTPEIHQRALENKKGAPENPHRLQCKSLFNVAELVSGMWKVAPEKKKFPWCGYYMVYIGF